LIEPPTGNPRVMGFSLSCDTLFEAKCHLLLFQVDLLTVSCKNG